MSSLGSPWPCSYTQNGAGLRPHTAHDNGPSCVPCRAPEGSDLRKPSSHLHPPVTFTSSVPEDPSPDTGGRVRAWARPGPAVTRHLPRGLGTPHLTGLGARNPRLACLPYHHFACPSSMWTLGRRAWLLPPRSTWSQAGTGQAATRKKGQLGSLILCPWSHKALLPGPRRSS